MPHAGRRTPHGARGTRLIGGRYADVENPVFFNENTDMLLGNAKKTCEDLKVKVKVSCAVGAATERVQRHGEQACEASAGMACMQ